MPNKKIKKKKEIIVNQGLIDEYIARFEEQNNKSEEVLKYLFANANHKDYNGVFCRVGLLDSLYSTQIQQYYKGGITAVSDHIFSKAGVIVNLINCKVLDDDAFKLFEELTIVDYSAYKDCNGKENKIVSFVSKYMSFCKPEMFPIMDSYVKKLINLSESVSYAAFVNEFTSFKDRVLDKTGKDYTNKKIDMFLWQYARDNKKEINNIKFVL